MLQTYQTWRSPSEVILLPSLMEPRRLPRIDDLLHQQNTPTTEEKPKTPKWRHSKFCTVEDCQRVSQRNGLCHRHGGKRTCKYEQCVSKDRGNGYCIKHGGGRPCDVAHCPKKARRQGMCTQHHRMIQIA
ncbi:hypothetical protein THRCLA_20328 [Thraustotheca clavata]|uniref:WRKY19-like zinc finger domain-containing protein n=1 Tax=Thraustotheca clavata TaxID=74557 RepID=A0A1W0A8M9_9STRA|nr:hypothetical protein THRCLA_20328 [Thraustotheca clavata]